jgi:purine-binding chemotaxis protein CheW
MHRGEMSPTIANDSTDKTRTLAGRYLTFRCGNESYGIRVLSVREIIRQAPITTVPRTPSYIRGVLNLRGRIIPVIDLRHRFGQGTAEVGDRTCIVVVQVSSATREVVQMGLIVDAVEEVVNIAPSDVSETPDFGQSVDTSFLLGMAKVGGAVKALLNLDRVLSNEQIDGLAAISAGEAA